MGYKSDVWVISRRVIAQVSNLFYTEDRRIEMMERKPSYGVG